MNENNLQEIEDILTRFDEMYDLAAQDVAVKLRISSVHLSRVRHGEYGDKAVQSLLSKLRKLADEYGLFVEPSREVTLRNQQELQLAQELERDAYHPALIQAAYRRFGLDPSSLGWANLFMGTERLNDLIVQAATYQHVRSQQARMRTLAQPMRQPLSRLSSPRQRIAEPPQQLQIAAPAQRVTVSEVSQQETLQSFYNELSDHRK